MVEQCCPDQTAGSLMYCLPRAVVSAMCGTCKVDDDATPEDIKAAYRYLAKQCHPDQRGDIGHDMCVLLNEVSCQKS